MLRILIGYLLVGVGTGLSAQTTLPTSSGVPSAEQMIQQLEKKAPAARKFRNFSVEPVQGEQSGIPDQGAAVPAKGPVHGAAPALSLLIEFDYDSARVRPESKQVLALLAQALQSEQLRHSHFAVEGHTDAKGSASYNQKLSLMRASAVRDILISQGVTEARVQAAGKGSTELANAAQPFAPENRRVRVVNLD